MNKILNILGIHRSGHNAIRYWLACQHKDYPDYRDSFKVQNFHHRHYDILVSPSYIHINLVGKRVDFTINHLSLINQYLEQDKLVLINNEMVNGLISTNGIWVGPFADRIVNVFILRDAYNNFASIDRFGNLQQYLNQLEDLRKTWIDCAKVYGKEKTILFNKWHTSAVYRKQICDELGLYFTDLGFNRVSSHGGGSSFDKLTMDFRAHEMDVNRRYLQGISPRMQHFLGSQEIVDLNIKIFGMYAPKELNHLNPWYYKAWVWLKNKVENR